MDAAMYDVVIRRGTVIDGTGKPRRTADIGIRGDRIAAVGRIEEAGVREIDAAGRIIAPGFIDIHTHYDAQLLWDGTASPSPLHGVTTVVAGNCGLSLAPVKPADQEYLVRMLSRVEAIPVESLLKGVNFEWQSFGEYLDCLEKQDLALNVGVMVGHAAIRRWVMGPDASQREANEAEIEEMRTLVKDALAAGALGFSSSTASTQVDGDERPTPPQFAAADEFVALAATCRDYPGTSLEFIPGTASSGFTEDRRDVKLLAAMSRESGRPINWNTVLLDYPGLPDIQDRQLDAVDEAREMGGFVVPQIIPHNFRVRIDLLDCDIGFHNTPAFAPLYELKPAERVSALKDPEWRGRLIEAIETLPDGANRAFFSTALPRFTISDARPPEMQDLVGRTVADIAQERGQSVLETIFDLAAEAELHIGFQSHLVPVETEEQRALRRRVLRDERLMLGASDGGAHVLSVINVEYPTESIRELVNQEAVFTLEELVQEFTDIPAKLYGLRNRGRIEEGYMADILIFDEAQVGTSGLEMRYDFPGEAPRLYNSGTGIDCVMVAGKEVVRDGEFTTDRPGRLLRSGIDTEDVPWDEILCRSRAGSRAEAGTQS